MVNNTHYTYILLQICTYIYIHMGIYIILYLHIYCILNNSIRILSVYCMCLHTLATATAYLRPVSSRHLWSWQRYHGPMQLTIRDLQESPTHTLWLLAANGGYSKRVIKGLYWYECQHLNHWILNDIKVSQLQTKPHQTIIFVDPLYWRNMDFFSIVPQTQFLRVTNCLPVRLSAFFLLQFKLKLSGNTCLGQNQTNPETQGDDNYNNDQHLQSRQMVWRFNI